MYLKASQKMSVVMKLLWNCSANLSSTFYVLVVQSFCL